jgi:hypothetical protein
LIYKLSFKEKRIDDSNFKNENDKKEYFLQKYKEISKSILLYPFQNEKEFLAPELNNLKDFEGV